MANIYYTGSNSNNMLLNLRLKYINGSIATAFPNNIVYGNQVIVESDIDYQNDLDLNKTRVEVALTGDNYSTIAEWIYSGSGHVTLNRFTGVGTTDYFDLFILSSLTNILNDTRQGMFPVNTSITFHKYIDI